MDTSNRSLLQSRISDARGVNVWLPAGDNVELVITDIVMPGMNGIALGRTLNDVAPDLPVLFITGFADTRLEGTHTALLQKPFCAQQLLGKVASMLAGEKVA